MLPGDITRYNELATAEEAAEVGKKWMEHDGTSHEQVMAKLIEERQKHGLNASECLGNGLEAGPRRCVPKTALREAVGGLGGIWCR